MTATHSRPLSQEQIEARIEMRVAHLRVLAAQTAVDWWRSREPERHERIRRLLSPKGHHGRAWPTGRLE